MAEDKMSQSAEARLLDAGLLRALQARPAVTIPGDFAARVAARLGPAPALLMPALELTPRRYGRLAAIACTVVLAALMLACAHRLSGNSVYWLSLESLFGLQFVLLTVWIAVRDADYNLCVP